MPNPVAAVCPPVAQACEPAANQGGTPATADASFAKTLQGQSAKASAADSGGAQASTATAADAKNSATPATAASSIAETDPAAGAQAADAIAAILALLRPQAKTASAASGPNADVAVDAMGSSADNAARQKTMDATDMAATAANAAWAIAATTPAPLSAPANPDANPASADHQDGANLPANLAGGEAKLIGMAPNTHAGTALPSATATTDNEGGDGFQAALTAAAGHEATTPTAVPAAALASAAASAAAHSAPATATPVQHNQPVLNVASAVGSASWGTEVGDRLNWMISHQEQRADLVLNPPHLGRIEVSLSINGDQANAIFVSANPAVRDAISNAMPQLREQMAAFGVSLGQTQVGADSAGQSAQQQASDTWRGTGGGDATKIPAHSSGWLARGRGLVDTFA